MGDSTMVSCIATCVLMFMICVIVMKLIQRRRLYKLALQFDGPASLPIIGNAHLFIGDTEDIMKRLNQLVASYPSPFRLWLAHYLVFLAHTPEQLKVICLSPKTVEKGDLFDLVKPWLGTGLLTASAPKWQMHRELIGPTFHVRILQSFIEVFAARAVNMINEMERNLDGPEFEISDYLAQYALLAVCETTMGVSLDVKRKSNRDYVEAVHRVITTAAQRAFRPWIYPDFIFSRTRDGKDQQRCIKFLHAFTDDVIQKKKKKLFEGSGQTSLADKGNNDDAIDVSTTPRRKAFLDHLMQLSHDGKALSDEALREEVDTMMATGSDATAAVSCYTMLMLACHPEIQEKVYDELCEIHGNQQDHQLNVTRESLNRMTYLERVIKETMRVFPIVPYIIRKVTDDLELGDQTLPKGSQVVLAIIDIHRSDKYWQHPLKFDPDRFLPEEMAKHHPYSYLPFSGGPRNCIGLKYGMLSVKTVLATILWKFILKKDHVVPIKDIRLKMEFVLRTIDPIKLRIERRKRSNASD